MLQKIQKFFKKFTEKGQGLVEYALILGFAAVIGALLFKATGVQTQTSTALSNITTQGSAVNDLYTTATSTG